MSYCRRKDYEEHKNVKQENPVNETIINEIKNSVNENVVTEIKKTHPRMYGVARITFNDIIENGDVDTKIPYAVRNGIMKAIEDLGYSITIEYDGSAIVNAIKKQLQHDA